MVREIAWAAVLILVGIGPALADPQEVQCRFQPGWNEQQTLSSATIASDFLPAITVDERAMVQLADVMRVRFVVPLGKPVGLADKGGLIALHVVTAGTYRIAVQRKAWIDVVHDGKPLVSTAHAHGASCSGTAKTVDFALTPGDFVIQISDTVQPLIGVAVTKQP